MSVHAVADGAVLHSVFQKLEAAVTSEGLSLKSTAPGEAGSLGLGAHLVGREGASVALAATGAVTVTGHTVRFARPGLVEEYSTSVEGIRQDFVVEARPAGEGPLEIGLALSGASAEVAEASATLRLDASNRVLTVREVARDGRDGQVP